jgi:hypothetical protein
MAIKVTTSVNIIRDSERALNYIPTPNGIKVANQIANDFKKGTHSYNIIGSYGTGKSSFLWAFQQSITGKKKHFGVTLLSKPTIEFINIIGEYKSLIDVFADYFSIKDSKQQTEQIFTELFNKYHDLGKNNPLLIVVLDEFGKFLEYASQNEPEKELYFIQQLAEFVNNPDVNILLVTTVHQNFDAYALDLNAAQKQEWTKVKGRFREITFNEPVEQLLFLAAEHLDKLPSTVKREKDISKTVELLIKAKAFNINEDYVATIAEKLYPLDVIAAYVLTLSLQKYGQNERSLFSFLESTDHTGLYQHKELGKGTYAIPEVYDYLVFNFYSFLNSRYNPDFAVWKLMRETVETIEASFEENTSDYIKIVKTIGLLNLIAQNGAKLDEAFLINYAETNLQIKGAKKLIAELAVKKLIHYRKFSNRFILFGGTDLDIQTALINAGSEVDEVRDVVTLLNRYFALSPVLAKKVNYETGTPRLFDYKITALPISDIPEGEIDGFINLVFNEQDIESQVQAHSANSKEAIFYCYYRNSKTIKELLFEIEKTKKVIEGNIEDKVAVRELTNILVHQQNLLSHKILNNYTSSKNEVVWYFKGKEVVINSKKKLNSQLSIICENIYYKAPIFNNELANKHKISTSIHTAKRNYFKALTTNWDKPQLGFPVDKFPPEKTIYLSLLENNNIGLYVDTIREDFSPSSTYRFNELWLLSESFLHSAKTSKRKVSEFVTMLGQPPFKLKQGLVDFWVPTFLFMRRDDFALFANDVYIPLINDEVLDLMGKKPQEYEIKTFAVEGVKLDVFNSYRIATNLATKQKLSNASFIETVRPYLTFYRSLEDYSKHTKRISKEAQQVRAAIVASKDPEHTFFEAFPLALGFSINDIGASETSLQAYVTALRNTIKELRTSYDDLVARIEHFITEDILGDASLEFEDYKAALQARYKKLRRHLLQPKERVFVQRLDSEIDDKKAWLNSLVQSLINTTLDKIKDEDEVLVCDKFKGMILALDSLTNLSKADFKEDKEDVFDLQINSFFDGVSKKLVRLPKSKKQEVSNIQGALKATLSADKTLNIAALTNLLKELLNNHE